MRKGSFLKVEPGVELYYEVSGEGPPLIFIPGWTFTTEVFDQQVVYFSRTHKVVSFDPRSQGRSTISLHGNDYSTQSDDLCKLIDHLELEKPVLIGWSFGSLPLWGFVRLRGTEPVKGMVFIDMPPVPVKGESDGWTWSVEMASDFYQALMTPKGHREFATFFVQEDLIKRDLAAEELDWLVTQSTRSPAWVAAAYTAAGAFSNYLPEAQQVDQTLSTLFVVSEACAEGARPYLAKHLPNANVEFLGGHMMFWEYPDRFNAILENYLRALD